MGEIRDAETAAIAVQSALTGHRVLSSVHANDAFSVIDRFLYMDVEAATFLESLNGVVSQRLVRRLCPHCGGGSVAPAAMRGLSWHRLPGPHRAGRGVAPGQPHEIRAAGAVPGTQAGGPGRLRRLSMRDAAGEAVARGLTTYQEVCRAVAME